MDEGQKDKAEQIAKGGKSIASISKELGVSYMEVHAHVTSVHALSWIGAKRSITNRLNLLKKERNRAQREILVNEATELVNYIYYSGKELGGKIDRARGALARVRNELGE